MGWQTIGKTRFYYRKQRYTDVAGRSRVRSLYCGSGERGEAAAREDEERRALAKAGARSAPALEGAGGPVSAEVAELAPPASEAAASFAGMLHAQHVNAREEAPASALATEAGSPAENGPCSAGEELARVDTPMRAADLIRMFSPQFVNE